MKREHGKRWQTHRQRMRGGGGADTQGSHVNLRTQRCKRIARAIGDAVVMGKACTHNNPRITSMPAMPANQAPSPGWGRGARTRQRRCS